MNLPNEIPTIMTNLEILQFIQQQGIKIKDDKGIVKLEMSFLMETWCILISGITEGPPEKLSPMQMIPGSTSSSRMPFWQKPLPGGAWGEEDFSQGKDFIKKFKYIQSFLFSTGERSFGLADLTKPDSRRVRYIYTLIISILNYSNQVHAMRQPIQERLNALKEEKGEREKELSTVKKEKEELESLKERIASDTEEQKERLVNLREAVSGGEETLNKLKEEEKLLKKDKEEALKHRETAREKDKKVKEEVESLKAKVVENPEMKLQNFEAYKSRLRDERRELQILEDELRSLRSIQKAMEQIQEEMDKMGTIQREVQELSEALKVKREEKTIEVARSGELKEEEKSLEQDTKLKGNALVLRKELYLKTKEAREQSEKAILDRIDEKKKEIDKIKESLKKKQKKTELIEAEIVNFQLKIEEIRECKQKLLAKAKELNTEIERAIMKTEPLYV